MLARTLPNFIFLWRFGEGKKTSTENIGKNMFRNLKYILIVAMLCLTAASAATVAVLEITIANDEVDLTVDQTKFLTDELRRQATRILPKDYSVLTREKILALIPETAENLNSVINIGMVIKSDYVTRGSIDKLGDLFALTVEIYETSSGNLLGDFVKESTNYKGLLDAIRENAPDLFVKIMPETAKEPQTTSISTNIPDESKKSKSSFWVAIGLDVLGATAIGLGIYNNTKVDDYHRESQNLLKAISGDPKEYVKRKSEFDDKYNKMQSAEKLRNIFYATGGALLLGGVAVHIWF